MSTFDINTSIRETEEKMNEGGTPDLREALYLMSQNPPYKFVRLEVLPTSKFFYMTFKGDKISEAQLRYIKDRNGTCLIDFSKLKVLACEIECYMKNLEDYCI